MKNEAMKKPKKKTMTSKVEALTKKVEKLEANIKTSDSIIEGLKEDINSVRLKLKSFINQHTSQIRVLEKDGTWSGYTGVFHLDPKDNKKRVIEKAMNHYNYYFKNADFYKNRTLGLFITNNKEKKLIKVLQDNQDKLKKNVKN